MKVTYYGHSCFAVNLDGIHLLFDPFISGNPAAGHIDPNSIFADYILISHAHQDHLLDTETIAHRTDASLISNFEIIQHFIRKGLDRGHALNLGGRMSFDFGSVQFVNAVHSSSFPDGSYGGNPGGFVVTPKGFERAFYYAGDTALTYDMKLIGEDNDIAFALLPLGDVFTMNAKEALRCAEFVGTDTIIGIHYNTFAPIRIDTSAAVDLFRAAGKTLLLPKIGETIDL